MSHVSRQLMQMMARDRALVIHVATGTIGRALRFYTGEGDDVYRREGYPDVNPIAGAVMALEEGDSFVIRDENAHPTFVRLSDEEAKLYQVIQQAVTGAIGELANFAASMRIEKDAFERLARSVLMRQTRAFAAASLRI